MNFKLPFNLPPFLEPIYGEDSIYRPWAIALTLCLIACLPKGTRRLGGIAFVVIVVIMTISLGLSSAFKQYMPD